MRRLSTLLLVLSGLTVPASAQIDLPRPPAERPAPSARPAPKERPAPSAKPTNGPRMTCTVCGDASQPVPAKLPAGGLPPKAWCAVCRDQRFFSVPKGASRPAGSAGGLDLPRDGRATPLPVRGPASEQGAPAAGSVAAQVVLGEVSKRRRLDDPLLGQAVESLAGMGEQGLVSAREGLVRSEPTVVLVCARVLLGSEQAEDRALVTRRIEGRTPGSVGGELVKEVVARDPVLASPEWLASLVAHPQNSVRAAAHRVLLEGMQEDWIPLLVPVLESRSSDARYRAVDLIASTGSARAVAPLLQSLADSRAKVGARVIEFLARHPDPSIAPALLERAFGERWILRDSAFALLALVEREDARLEPSLGPGHVEALLRGTSVADPFVTGACALALSGVGFRSEDPLATAWLDTTVPGVLMDLVAGREYFQEREVLVEAAVRRLQLITGQSYGQTSASWIDWWSQNARDFHASRAVLAAGPEDASRLRLDVFDRGAGQRYTLLGPAWVEREVPASATEAFYLDAGQAQQLLQNLETNGVLSAAVLPGVRGAEPARGRGFEIRLDRQAKSFTFSPGVDSPWAKDVLRASDVLRDQLRWQRFVHPTEHGERPQLVLAERDQMAITADPDLRDRHFVELVLAWLPTQPYDERTLGYVELERPEHLRHLGVGDVEVLLTCLREEPFLTPRCRRVIALARSAAGIGDSLGEAGLQVELREELIDLLHDRYGVESAGELASLLSTGGSTRERAAAADERPLLRAVAAAALAQRQAPEDVLLLKTLLEDPEDVVEVAALQAVGQVRIDELRGDVLVRAALDRPAVRSAALRALGRLGGDQAREVLLTSLTDPSGLYRLPAAEGLVDLEDPLTAEVFLSMLRTGRDRALVDQARRGLLRLGAAAHDTLRAALSSPAPGARESAALVLSRQGLPEAFPVLLRAWANQPENLSLRDELVVLSCRDARERPAPVDDWWRWWDSVKQDDSLSWFRAACETRSLATPPLAAFATGSVDAEGVAFLLDVMQRPEAWLVERARRELERVAGVELDDVPAKEDERGQYLGLLRERLLDGARGD